MTRRARIRILAALVAAGCASDPTGGGELLVVSEIDVQPPGASISIGGTQQFSATPKTSSGITVPNRTVTWSSSDQGIATISTSGLVTGVAVGVSTITAQVDDIHADVTVQVTPKPVASVTVEPPQVELQVGGAQQLQATARDAQGQPLPNRPITFASDNPAIASVSTTGLVVAITQGNTTVRATSEGRTGTSTITVSPRPASRLGFVTQPANGTAGQALGPVRVAVQDDIGATIGDAITSITMSIADNPGGATLGGTVTVNAVAGIATFANLVLDKTGAGFTLRASAAPLSPALSNPFTIAAGAAARLAVTTQPSPAAQSGVPLPVQPVVQITDAGGNAVTQAGVAITVQLVGAGATLGGVVTVNTGANGSAAFTNLVLSGNAGNYTLRFVSAGLTDALSNVIVLSAGTATGLTLVTPPSGNATSGVPFAQQPIVQLHDGNNAPVALAGVPVTVAPASGGGTLAGQTVVNTDANGRAVFTGLALSGPAGVHTLAFSAPNIGQVVSPPITLAAGGGSRLVIVTQPSANATNGSPFLSQPSLQLFDAGGNQLRQAGVVITASLPPGGAATTGFVTATTNANGLATFDNLSITGLVGTYRITFSATGFTSAESSDIVLGPGLASRLAFLTQPAGAANAQPLTQQPRLQLTDVSGNVVASAGVNVTAALASGPGVLGGTLVATTDASGIATFVNLSLTGAAGVYTIGFTAPGVPQAVSDPIGLGAGVPTQLGIVTQPSATSASGAAFAQQPVIELRDAANNPTAQAGVTITATIASGGGALIGTVSAITDAFGKATFTNLGITGLVGPHTLRFSATSLADVVSGTITLTVGAPAQLVITTQPSAAAVNGTPFAQQPVVQVRDGGGNPVPQAGINVTVAIASGGGTLGGTATVATNGSGQAVFAGLSITGTPGDRTLTFTSPGLGSATSSTITLSPQTPTQLAITTQPSASVQSGVAFPVQPAVQLQDGGGSSVPQAGVVITAAIFSGGGTLLGTLTATTNASGTATFTNLAISGIVGNRTLRFTSGALTPATSNTIAVTPGAPTQLVLTVQPSPTASSGVPFAQQPVVRVQDAAGNNITGLASFPVTAAIASGSGATLGGSTVVATDVNGIATFTNLALTGTSGNFTLSFSGGGYTQAVSNTIGLGAGAASKLAITTQPSASVQNGQVFPQQPAIQLQDGSNNPVAQAGVIITVTILSGNPALSGTLNATTNAAGLATFTNLAITGLIGNRTLIFAASGFVSATSNTITVTPGSAQALAFTTPPPAAAQSGVLLAPQPAVHLEDQSGNPVSQAGVNITASIASGGGSLGGTATVATNGAGVATFTNLSISGLVGVRTLAFNSAGLSGVTSGGITLSAGSADHLTITTQPGTPATNGSPLTTQPQVQLRDAAGNPVGQAGVLVTAVIGAGSPAGALTNATATTNAAGLATFSGLTITGLAGTYTLQFTSAGLTSSPLSTGIALGAGGAFKLAISTAPSAAAQSGIAIPTQPAIQVQDQSGNPVSSAGVTITAVIATDPGGTPSLANATANTNGSGLATFVGLAITGTTGGYTLQFTSGALAPVTSGTITLSAGNAAVLDMFTEPSAAAQSGVAFATQPVVRARDGGGNVVSGVLITAAIASGAGGATLGGTLTVATAGNGRATFGSGANVDLFITGLVGPYTLQFTTPGATSVTSQTITLSAGAASKLAITTQPSAAARNDQPFPTQPVIHVQDAAGNPVNDGGLLVTAAIASGGGVLGTTVTATTNGSGVATFATLKITGTIGTRTLGFSAPSRTGVTSNNVVVSAGTATQIVMVTQPPVTVQNGATLVPSPVVDLRDISGNDVDSAGIAIAVAIATGGGTLGGTTPQATAGNGQATFNDLTITGTAGNRTLQFTHAGLTTATSNLVGVTAGSPAALTITQQPSANASNDVAFAQQPIVQVTDGSGNPVANQNVSVSLTGGGTLSGSLSALTDGAGLANFSGLTIVGLAGTKGLTFTLGGLSTPSDPIALAAGAATKLVITTEPVGAASGDPLATQPVVELRDSGDNPVSDSGVNITAVLLGAGTLTGTNPVATLTGVSSFTDLVITGPGTYKLRFDATGLASATSIDIVIP